MAPDPIRVWALYWDRNDGKPTYSVIEPEPPPSLGNRLIVGDLTLAQAALIVKNHNDALGRAFNRRTLDDTWRQIYRFATQGDELPYPTHDELLAKTESSEIPE